MMLHRWEEFWLKSERLGDGVGKVRRGGAGERKEDSDFCFV